MPKAIRIHAHGGPEVLTYEDADPGRPGAGQVLIRHTAIGLNFIDVYHRSGLYPPPGGFPLIPGGEAAGVVLSVGADVDWLKAGDRIAYAVNVGAYAEQRVIAADRVVKVPDGISDEQAAGMMLKGMTAEYLLRRTFKVKAGDTILFHAAAGGVGLILGQWAKHLGVTVIGTASSADKIELAKAHGFDHVINY
ncbi:MAG: quinone oxidoreductase, partial [Mesorhizobium sp.]